MGIVVKSSSLAPGDSPVGLPSCREDERLHHKLVLDGIEEPDFVQHQILGLN